METVCIWGHLSVSLSLSKMPTVEVIGRVGAWAVTKPETLMDLILGDMTFVHCGSQSFLLLLQS